MAARPYGQISPLLSRLGQAEEGSSKKLLHFLPLFTLFYHYSYNNIGVERSQPKKPEHLASGLIDSLNYLAERLY